MSGYGPPPSAPPTSSGASGLGLPTIIAYVAGGLGVLDFIWGFLDWTGGDGSDGASGYVLSGGAAVGLALAAGLWAAGRTLEKDSSEPALGPVALSVAALLVVFGNLVGQPDGTDTKVGMILALITTLVQAAALVYGFLLATGKIAAPQPKPQAPQGYGPPQGGPSGPPQGYGAPQGYGPPQGGPSGPPPGYGAPQGPPSGPPQGPPQGGGYGAPSSYGSPQGGPSGPPSSPSGPPPGYGAPPSGGPSSPPPPPAPPSGNPYSPPSGS